MINAMSIVKDVEKRLKELFGDRLVSIILYGSYAHGNPDDESDVDILALVSDQVEDIEKCREKITDIITEISSLNDVFVSIIIKNDVLFYERSTYVPFYMNVKSQGITLNG
jgi:uncharacterized protein